MKDKFTGFILQCDVSIKIRREGDVVMKWGWRQVKWVRVFGFKNRDRWIWNCSYYVSNALVTSAIQEKAQVRPYEFRRLQPIIVWKPTSILPSFWASSSMVTTQIQESKYHSVGTSCYNNWAGWKDNWTVLVRSQPCVTESDATNTDVLIHEKFEICTYSIGLRR